MELYVGIPTANLRVDVSRLFAPDCPTGLHRPLGWDTCVLGLARHQLVHRLGCQPFPVRLAGSRACHRSALSMVIDALASALVTPWSTPSTRAAPAAASSRVCWSGFQRAASR